MSTMNKPENVAKQYSNDKNLSTRMSLHQKYSTNKKRSCALAVRTI